jgi:hypothetical protein
MFAKAVSLTFALPLLIKPEDLPVSPDVLGVLSVKTTAPGEGKINWCNDIKPNVPN